MRDGDVLEYMGLITKQKRKQTNEEWRKTCSAEEFAEFLSDVVFNAIVDYRINKDNCEKEDGNFWLKWLKQPRKE